MSLSDDEALSPLDAAFLYMERERAPMHMASVGILEGGPLYAADGRFRIEDIRELISGRLPLAPKLRQKANAGLLGEAPPVWADDPAFEISDHVRTRVLPSPGSETEFRRLCGELMATPLDRARPLWDLTFVEGLADDKVGVIERLHHSMSDGLAAAALATVLLDVSPEAEHRDGGCPWAPRDALPVWKAAMGDLLRLGGVCMRAVAWGGRSVLHPLGRLREAAELCQAMSTVMTPTIIAPRSSLNRSITAARSVDFVRLSFAQSHDVAGFFDATVNDVLLTIVTGGLRRLLESRGELKAESELQALVPVGLPSSGDRLSNSISALFVRLPIGLSDPVEVLRRVSAEVKLDRNRHQSLVVTALLRLFDPLPQGVMAVASGVVHRQPFINLIVTNVPGPPVPLYVLGGRLLEAFPIVPLGGNQSLGVAALSYDGRLNLGVLSDPATLPDVGVFCQGVEWSLQALTERSRMP
ncbi:MAG: wax ester/triacylglycerol synthase family O-acyltransferase [Acidimicrobiales bacterium]